MVHAENLNFSGQNLQRRSFRGQDLAGANFANADIRGADFREATLTGATFTFAHAGIAPQYQRLGAISLTLLSVTIGLIATAITAFVGYLLFPFSIRGQVSLAPIVVFAIAAIIGVTLRRGLAAAVWTALGAGIGLGALLGQMAGRWDAIMAGAIAVPLIAVTAVLVIIADAIVVTTARLVAGRMGGIIAIAGLLVGCPLGAKIGVTLGQTVAQVLAVGQLSPSKIAATTHAEWAAAIGGGAAAGLVVFVSHRALVGESRFAIVRQRAVAISAIAGTRFHQADLTDTSFQSATLPSSDFRHARLIRTNFHQASGLDRARVEQTILASAKVRSLLVSHRGSHQSFVGENLQGAYLVGAVLQAVDFTDANLSQATLEHAALVDSIWIRTRAIGTNLRSAQLTGACLEAWHIDSTTQLQDIQCNYLYLRAPQQERRPSSGMFQAGDFSDLFQQVIHTIDLIFRTGVEQQAFNYSLHQLQVENDGMPLSIRSLEKKNNGSVVVRVDVPPESDKAKLHTDFLQHYHQAVDAIAVRYQAELQAKDEQITIYRSQLADWKEVMQLLAHKPATPAAKFVVLHVGEGDLNLGFPVALQISSESRFQVMQCTARLAPAPELVELYAQWRSHYRKCLSTSFRLDVPDTQITNVSRQDFLQDVLQSADALQRSLNRWLNAESFRSIKERLLEQLASSEPIQMVLQTDDCVLQRLPLQQWDFFDRYPNAELALSTPNYESIAAIEPASSEANILAILGDSTGIDVQRDRDLLSQLPDAVVTVLVEPSRPVLTDHLWAQPWQILFFAGHSSTQPTQGQFVLNSQETLTIAQLKHGLRHAISQGLKLAIFNSCDGLGLVRELADLQLPYLIVMREPVPDLVAQAFLKHFLNRFAQGDSLYQAVRTARERLQGLEDHFPCATWLPVLYQNPAAPPLLWTDLHC